MSTSNAVISNDADGTIVSWNPAAERMYGYSAQEAIGKHISMLVPPERLHEVPDILSQVARGEQLQLFDSVCLRKDGSRFDVSLAVTVIRDKNGGALGISTIAHDITVRKQAEDALRRSEQSLALRNQIFNVFLTASDQQMYQEVLQIAVDATKSRYGLFGYIAEDGALVVPSMSSEVWQACEVSDKQARFPHDVWAGIWGRALDQKQAFYSNHQAVFPMATYPSNAPWPFLSSIRMSPLACSWWPIRKPTTRKTTANCWNASPSTWPPSYRPAFSATPRSAPGSARKLNSSRPGTSRKKAIALKLNSWPT